MKRLAQLLPVCLLGFGACSNAPASELEPAPYLFVWAGDHDEREGGTNFLAVIDADPASATYGDVVATAPLGGVGGMPHHSELLMPPDRPLFANAFMAGETWLFDLSDPLHPTAVAKADPVPGYHMPHSFLRAPDGTVLATLQFSEGDAPGRPGALVRFSAEERLTVPRSAVPSSSFHTAPIEQQGGV